MTDNERMELAFQLWLAWASPIGGKKVSREVWNRTEPPYKAAWLRVADAAISRLTQKSAN